MQNGRNEDIVDVQAVHHAAEHELKAAQLAEDVATAAVATTLDAEVEASKAEQSAQETVQATSRAREAAVDARKAALDVANSAFLAAAHAGDVERRAHRAVDEVEGPEGRAGSQPARRDTDAVGDEG